MEQRGYLILSDISGYTSYLNKSELEHAHGTLTELLNLLIEWTQSPLQIFKLEGDAIFSYAPTGGFHQGQTLLETIENCYVAFRQAIELMTINTSCLCNACRYIPNLDLKFFVHYGTFSIQDLGPYQELLGRDVNLVHRITKNKISERLGKRAYAAYTQAVVDQLAMTDLAAEMERLEDSYADLGTVTLFVHDMHEVWERRKEEARLLVTPEEALHVSETRFPVPPSLLWEYITKPEYRSIFFNSDSQVLETGAASRVGQDSVYVCAHGDTRIYHTILDWQPFEQYTMRQFDSSQGLNNLITLRLIAQDEGEATRLQFIFGHFEQRGLKAWLLSRVFPLMMKRTVEQMLAPIINKINADIKAGDTATAPRIQLGEGLAAEEARMSLAGMEQTDSG